MRFLALALFAAIQIASAQNVEKVLYFAHITQDLPGAATGIRTIASLNEAVVDDTKKSLTLRGSPDQVALGEWLLKALDVATSGPGDPNVGAPYRVSGSDDIVRVLYLTYAGTVQEQQEVATLCRTTAEIRQVWVYTPQKALILRGTSEQLAMVEWISSQLERHKQGQPTDAGDFKLASGSENTVRVFWASTPPGVREFQTMATLLRTTAEIRRVFTYNEQKAIAVRGTADQVTLATWLMRELDQPAHISAPYVTSNHFFPIVRVFFLTPAALNSAGSDAELERSATELRTTGHIMHVFTYPPTRAIAVRAPDNQIALAETMLQGKLLAKVQ